MATDDDEALGWDTDERDRWMDEHDNDDYQPDVEPEVVVADDE